MMAERLHGGLESGRSLFYWNGPQAPLHFCDPEVFFAGRMPICSPAPVRLVVSPEVETSKGGFALSSWVVGGILVHGTPDRVLGRQQSCLEVLEQTYSVAALSRHGRYGTVQALDVSTVLLAMDHA
jgi:hypothetical protein